ncbi:unnamed protein product, partial [Allacma fusca]
SSPIEIIARILQSHSGEVKLLDCEIHLSREID